MYDSQKNVSGFSKLADLKEGDTVVVDKNFDCMSPMSKHVLEKNDGGALGIKCTHGFHEIADQVDDIDTGVVVGIWKDGTVPAEFGANAA